MPLEVIRLLLMPVGCQLETAVPDLAYVHVRQHAAERSAHKARNGSGRLIHNAGTHPCEHISIDSEGSEKFCVDADIVNGLFLPAQVNVRNRGHAE